MPPIRTYQDAPLHPDGATPKTASAPDASTRPTPASNVVPEPTRTSQLPATSDPPPPQPGARPIPPAPTSTLGGPAPPAPGANPNYIPSVTATITSTTTSTIPPPPQLNMSSPTANDAPTKSTSSVPPPPRSGQATTINFGAAQDSPIANSTGEERHSLEHPPSYVQNPYAADGTASERARLEAAAQNEAGDSVWGAVKSAANEATKYAQNAHNGAWQWIERKGSK